MPGVRGAGALQPPVRVEALRRVLPRERPRVRLAHLRRRRRRRLTGGVEENVRTPRLRMACLVRAPELRRELLG